MLKTIIQDKQIHFMFLQDFETGFVPVRSHRNGNLIQSGSHHVRFVTNLAPGMPEIDNGGC